MEKHAIAIIEDDVDLLAGYADILAADYELNLFSHPREFLDYLSKNKDANFKAILSDYNMPQMNGVEMVKALRAMKYTVPVIMVSAYLTKDTLFSGMDAGVVKFLDKPFTVEDVLKNMNRVVLESEMRNVNAKLAEISQHMQELTATFKLIFETHFDNAYLNEMFVGGEGEEKPKTMSETLLEIQTKFQSLMKAKTGLEAMLEKAS